MIHRRAIQLVAIVLILQPICCLAEEPKLEDSKKTTEIWYGVLDAKVQQLRLAFSLTKHGDHKYSGHLISLDQGKTPIPLDKVERSDTELLLRCTRLNV